MIILTNVIETGVSADIYKDMNTRRACETIDFISRDQTAQSSLYILIVLAHFHVMTTLMPPCWHQSMKGRVYLQKKKRKNTHWMFSTESQTGNYSKNSWSYISSLVSGGPVTRGA